MKQNTELNSVDHSGGRKYRLDIFLFSEDKWNDYVVKYHYTNNNNTYKMSEEDI